MPLDGPTTTIHVVVPKALKKRIAAVAKKERTTPSEIIRFSLEHGLQRVQDLIANRAEFFRLYKEGLVRSGQSTENIKEMDFPGQLSFLSQIDAELFAHDEQGES